MTAEEALEILNGNKDVWRELGYESIREFNKDWEIAFNMAIQALKYYAIQKEYRDRELDQDLFYFGDNAYNR